METLRERVESYMTLPELLDTLNVDFEELWDTSLSEFFREKENEIEELMEEYGQ